MTYISIPNLVPQDIIHIIWRSAKAKNFVFINIKPNNAARSVFYFSQCREKTLSGYRYTVICFLL